MTGLHKSLTMVLAGALLVAMTTMASAEVLFYDGFETDTPSVQLQSPYPVPTLDTGGGDVGDALTVVNGNPFDDKNRCEPVNQASWTDLPPLNTVAPLSGGGSNYVMFYRGTSSATSPLLEADLLGAPVSSDLVNISFDLYLKSSGGNNTAQFFVTDGTNTGVDDRLVNLFFQTDGVTGSVAEYDGSAIVDIDGLTFTQDTWQHIDISINLNDDTYTIDIDNGASTANSTLLASAAGRDVGMLHLSETVNGKVAYVDELTAVSAIPEPTTLLLGCFGLAGLLLVRRRRG